MIMTRRFIYQHRSESQWRRLVEQYYRDPGSTNTKWIAHLVDAAESAEHLLTPWEVGFIESWPGFLKPGGASGLKIGDNSSATKD